MSSTDVQGDDCTDKFGIINASSTLLQLILTGKLALNFERMLYPAVALMLGEQNSFSC